MTLERAAISAVYDELHSAYGGQGWWPAGAPFEMMVGAILTQRTSWHNVELALANLRSKGLLDPKLLRRTPLQDVEQAVRSAGFYRQKALRLHALCNWLAGHGGFASAARLNDAELRSELLEIKGVGPETADAIVLYAFRRSVFVVDAYFRRFFARIGMIDGTEPYDELRVEVQAAMRGTTEFYGEFHALIVTHAKERCRTRPRCESCVLKAVCDHAQKCTEAPLH